jgi:EAL and modified HD-GYP domain-containing signal transduction protein
VRPEPDLIWRIRNLRIAGYRFALSGYHHRETLQPLLDQMDFVKLSVVDMDEAALRGEVRVLRGQGIRLIGENIDTEEDFKLARSLLMNCYQGEFFARRETLGIRRVDPNPERVTRLFNLVLSDAPREVIETEFRQDAVLSYNLMRYVNSPDVGISVEDDVQSIQHAIALMGRKRLARWLNLLMLQGSRPHLIPEALLRRALIRARSSEQFAPENFNRLQRDHLFLTGLFSLLDVIYGQPIEGVVSGLRLPGDVRDALLEWKGPYYPYLALARACERDDTDKIRQWSRRLGIPLQRIRQIQSEPMV